MRSPCLLLVVTACGAAPAPRPAAAPALGSEELVINANADDRVQLLLLHDKGCLDVSALKATFDGKPVEVRNLGGHQGGCAYIGFDIARPPAHGGPVAVTLGDIEAVFDDLLAERTLRAASPLRPGDEAVLTADPPPGPVRDPVVQGVAGDKDSFLLEGGGVAQDGGRFRFRLPATALPGATVIYLRGAEVFEAKVVRCAGIPRCRAEVGVGYHGRVDVSAR